MANSKWSHLKAFMLQEQYKDINKLIWEDHAWITARSGERYKITDEWSGDQIDALFKSIRAHYHVHIRLELIMKNLSIALLLNQIFLN